MTGGAGKYISGHALSYIASSAWQNGLAEGSEELIEGAVDPIIDAITLKKGLEYNAGDIFKSAMLGFFSGSITGVAGATKYVVQTSKQYNQIKSDMATLNDYRQYATPEEKAIIDNELRKGQDALNAFEDVSVLSKFVKTEEDIETMNSEDALKTTSSVLTPTVETSADVQNSINSAIESLNSITQSMLIQNGINMDIDQYETLDQQQREDTAKVAQYARKLGLDVRFDTDLETQYIQDDKGISKIGVNGMLDNDSIIINPKSLTPQTSILAHEVTHVLMQTNKYEQFVSLIQDNADFKGALNKAREKYNGITDDILSEGVAMYVESNLSNPKFIKKLISYDSSLAYKIYDNVKAMFSSNEKTVQENAWRQAFEEFKQNGNSSYALAYSLQTPEVNKALAKNAYDGKKLKPVYQQIKELVNDRTRFGLASVGIGDKLKFAGVENTNIFVDYNSIVHSDSEKHPISLKTFSEVLENIPNETVYACDYINKTSNSLRKAILTEHNDKVYLISLKPDTTINGAIIDKVSSLFKKDDVYNYINESIKNGNNYYTNEKSNDFLARIALAMSATLVLLLSLIISQKIVEM